MIRKILCSAALGGLLVLGSASFARSTDAQNAPGGKPSQAATKSVTGKVTSIGDQGKSFAMEVNDGSNKRTMEFVIDKNTQVEGQVRTGATVLVDYQPTDSGQNLCVRVATQQG